MKKKTTPTEALRRIKDIILTVEDRCMAVDGPVTPTSQEITERELIEIYKLAAREL